MKLFCNECLVKTNTKNLEVISIKNNKRAIKGLCEICNTKKIVFLGDGLGGNFDIHSVLSKLGYLNPFAKYPGELHVPGYQYCGPNTRLDIRLDKNDNPKPGEKPINQTDAVCYQHDLNYREAGNDLSKKHQADKIMIEKLDQITPSGIKERIVKALINTTMKAKVKLGLGIALVPTEYRDLI